MNIKYLLMVGALCLTGCNTPTEKERQIIRQLNDDYSQYYFTLSDDYLGVKLKMQLKESKWDSLALKMAYDSSISTYTGTDGIPWVYLLVYDKSDNYLFTITKESSTGNYIFFKE